MIDHQTGTPTCQDHNDPTRNRVLVSAWTYGNTVSEGYSAYQIIQGTKTFGWKPFVLTWAAPWNQKRWHGVGQIHCRTPWWRSIGWGPNFAEFLVRQHSVARRISNRFSLLHQASPISLRVPSSFGLFGLPFLWGPIGGSIAYPPGFDNYTSSVSDSVRKFDRLRLLVDPSMLVTLKTARRIVVTTSMAAEIIPEQYQHKVIVVPEGISESIVLHTAPHEEPYIFSSGRLVQYKAIGLLIQAYAQLRGVENVKLLITGDGPMRSQLESLIVKLNLSNRVVLMGKVPKHENQRLMHNALFCCFPALREAFGHVYLEAAAAWKPVVATDWGGPRDLIVDGDTGFKVLGKNPAEHTAMLASRMQQLIDDRQLRMRLGEAAALRVAKNYTWQAVAKRYHEIYTELVS